MTSKMPNIDNPHVAVVGGGVAGLALAFNLRRKAVAENIPLRVTVFEKEDEAGGNLRTLYREGYTMEWGPNGFLDSEPATLRLVENLGLNDRLQKSSDATRRRFLLVRGAIREIPTKPGAFLKSDLLSTRGKIRMAGELLVPGRKDLGRAADDTSTDETMAEFGNRRLGKEFTETMLDPMAKGIFGGQATKLSLAAAFPRMVELEKEHGGLFKAMAALARKRKDKTSAGPSGVLTSFKGGMQDLIHGLAAALRQDEMAELVCSATVESIRPVGQQWEVVANGSPAGKFSAVVDASPAHAVTQHLADSIPGVSSELAGIPYSPMIIIALGFARNQVAHDLDGFGMLVPTKEKRDLLGALWTSSIFPDRTPEGKVLIRCMAGGLENPSLMELDDQEIKTLALAELRSVLGIEGEPEMVNIIRHKQAIAQYHVGHLARLKRIDQSLESHPGIFLAGSSYRGIAINSCLKEAESMPDKIFSHFGFPAGTELNTAEANS